MATVVDTVLTPPPADVSPVYRLVAGTELIGEYQDSGYQTTKYLVRRVDGQVMQLPLLLYRLAASLDGRDADRLATDLSAEFGRDLTPAQVSFLVEERLHPVGIVAPDHAATEDVDGPVPPVLSDPLLALRYRVGVPDLFAYIGPALSSPLPGRPTHPEVRALRPRARRPIVTWTALVVLAARP